MGTKCCTVGDTQGETIELKLRWTSAWARHLADDMQVVLSTLDMVGRHFDQRLASDHGGRSLEETCAELDAVRNMVSMLSMSIRRSFRNTDGRSALDTVLPEIARESADIVKMCDGERPIPVATHAYWRRLKSFNVGAVGMDDLPEKHLVAPVSGDVGVFRRMKFRERADYINGFIAEVVDMNSTIAPVVVMLQSEFLADFLKCPCENNDTVYDLVEKDNSEIRIIWSYLKDTAYAFNPREEPVQSDGYLDEAKPNGEPDGNPTDECKLSGPSAETKPTGTALCTGETICTCATEGNPTSSGY